MAIDPTPLLPVHDFDQISVLGKYTIQRKVGSGGMGAVYLAVDQQLKRTVALKVLPKDKASNQVLVRRFKSEGQAGAQLEHPNIVAVYESGEIDGYLYLAMEFVEGVDAFELLRKRGVLPAKRSLDIIKQVTLALQHAHERQIVHRDIKPSNLMIRERDGLVKLADMGLARIIEDEGESAITKAGTTVGTVDYMSPEQGRDSKAADIRSDLYSLGCTWYHLLAGKAPYPEGDLMNKLRAHALQPVPDPRNWNENVPAGVVAVLQRMMAKKPEDRYQTPAQLLADLSSPALLRGDFSADQLQLLGAAHAEPVASPTEDDPESPASPSRPRRQPSNPVSGRSKAAGADVDDPERASASPSKSQGKLPKTSGRESLPARGATLDPASAESDGGKRSRSERALPGRIGKPQLSETPPSRWSPNTLKFVLLGLVIAVAVGGILVSMKPWETVSVSHRPVVNPYATGESGVVPQVVPVVVGPPGASSPSPQTPPVTVVTKPPTTNSTAPRTISPIEPVASVPAAVDFDRTPFGGKIAFSQDGTGPIPSWVWQSRVKPQPTERPLTVRRAEPAAGEFRDLASALATVRGSAVIEFADAGPHEVAAFSKLHTGNWTLRGADGVSAVLVLRGEEAPNRISQGTLTLEGVHLVVPPEQSSAAFHVQQGVLAIRRSTLTHLGRAATEILLAEAGGRILLEKTVLRGTGTCRPVVLRGANTALVAGQSLLLAGNASAVQVESQDTANDIRLVALVASACFAGQSGLACQHQGRQPPQFQLHLHQSLVAYLPGHSAEAIGVQFAGWPKTAEALDQPRVPFVHWVAEKSAFIGWPHWAQLGFQDGATPLDVLDEDAWRGFWRQTGPTGTLIPTGADLRNVADSGALTTLEQLEIGLAGLQTEIAEMGPKWSELPEPPQSVLANVLAFGQRPTLPTSLESPDPGTLLRFDLKKSTLGKYINSEACPDGSTVIAFGSGLRTIDPFVVRQKRVQIVFEQSEGTLLMLQPGYKTEPGATRPAAWITVEDGQLTLLNGSFRLMSSTTRSYPERFLQLQGGLCALRNCRVEGVDVTWPLLETLPSDGHAPPQLLMDQSLIVGTKSLVRIGAAESVVEVRGSVLASTTGIAVTLDAGSTGSQCLLNHSTLSAAKSVFQILPVGEGAPVSLYSRETVFQGGGVMSLDTDATAIHWWGVENAYASGMKSFLITRASSGPQDFHRDWVTGWGAGHELLPVFGPNSTLLPSPPSNLGDVEPESFQLHADCAAAQAGPLGAGLGAAVSQVGPLRQPATPTTPAKGTPKAPLATPQKNNPGF